jgi:hypothetical protein
MRGGVSPYIRSLCLLLAVAGLSACEPQIAKFKHAAPKVSPSPSAANQVPVAADQPGLTVNDNATLSITLVGSDGDSDALTYSIVASPTHGSLTGTPPNVVYHPSAPYSGADSFTFKVNDGTDDSPVGIIGLTVAHINLLPNAPAAVTCTTAPTAASTLNACTLTAASPTDPDGDSITYVDDASTCAAVLVNASTGAATFTAPLKGATCVVRVKAYDGALYSSTTSSATITGANRAPSATDQPGLTVNDNATLSITLAGADLDGDTLTYSIVTGPAHGSLTGTPPSVVYHPSAPYSGTDSFTFKVNDGTDDSAVVATVGLTVAHINRAPNAPAAVTCTTSPVAASTLNACTLTASSPTDPDGDTVTYVNDASTCTAVVVNASTGAATYTAPAKGATCVVKIKAYDTVLYSSTVSSATITGANRAPSATAQTGLTVNEIDTLSITLGGTDPDGDTLTFNSVSAPSHGALTGTPPNLTYTPDAGYSGADTFYFKVNDGTVSSAYASIALGVVAKAGVPVTLYYCAGTVHEWNTVSNWYQQSNCTLAAQRIPTDTDSVVIQSGTFTDQPAAVTLVSFVGSLPTTSGSETANIHIDDYGTLDVRGGKWYGTNGSAATLQFSGASSNQGTLTGDATFADTSLNSGTITGDATFGGTSLNSGTVMGTATFNAASKNGNGGTVAGDATFNGTSENAFGATVGGDAYFNATSTNDGTVTGTANFNGTSLAGGFYGACAGNGCPIAPNSTLYFCGTGTSLWYSTAAWYQDGSCATLAYRTPTDGDAVVIVSGTFTDQPSAVTLSGYSGDAPTGTQTATITITAGALTITGGHWHGGTDSSIVATFSGTAINDGTLAGPALFYALSENKGTLQQSADFYVAATNSGTVDVDATFHGNARNGPFGTVSGNATFYDFAENGGTVGGNASFQDSTTAGGAYGSCSGNGC